MNLKELAEHLSLSPTTVSRALNGFPEVGEKTRARVVKAAEQHGYRPNSNARRLATGRTGAVGVVFPVERNALVDPHFLEFLAGVSETLGPQGLDILMSPTTADREIDTYDRLMHEGSVGGILVSGADTHDRRIEHLAAHPFPFVAHGRTGVARPYAYLDIDNEGAFRQATSLLLDLGHQRIGLINGVAHRNYSQDRRSGYLAALAERGLTADPALEAFVPMTVEQGYSSAVRLLEMSWPPTALLCGSTLIALGVFQALAERGLEPGRNVSVIAHDDGLPAVRADLMAKPLTVTRSSIRAAGARAASMLLARIAGTPVEALQEVWPVDLIVRASTGPAPLAGGPSRKSAAAGN
ncbi:MAG TPA: substrate-binding domain-containing protein [Microvirga sp.]|jgi:LacI family transcriptional regulator|nr:substrate-binding domain-containing protein [Microvirga sp.]